MSKKLRVKSYVLEKNSQIYKEKKSKEYRLDANSTYCI